MALAKLRLKLSKLFGLLAFFLVCVSDSCYEHTLLEGILFIVGVLFIGIGTLGRIWCSVFISGYKNNQLVTYGPYSICRNPLYFFSLIGLIGVGLTTESLTIPAVSLIAFTLYYPFVIKEEQITLSNIYGAQFQEYVNRTPAFFPKPSLYYEPEEYTIKPKNFRKFLTEAVWFIWMIGFVEFAELLRGIKVLPTLFVLY